MQINVIHNVTCLTEETERATFSDTSPTRTELCPRVGRGRRPFAGAGAYRL